jgi:hypothetical protein
MKPAVVLCGVVWCVLVAENVECRRWILLTTSGDVLALVTSEVIVLQESRPEDWRVPCFYIWHSRRSGEDILGSLAGSTRLSLTRCSDRTTQAREQKAVTALAPRAWIDF